MPLNLHAGTTASNKPSSNTTSVAASMKSLYRLAAVQFAAAASHSCKSRGHSGVEAGAPKGLAKNAYPQRLIFLFLNLPMGIKPKDETP